jgi:hypothetical protein
MKINEKVVLQLAENKLGEIDIRKLIRIIVADILIDNRYKDVNSYHAGEYIYLKFGNYYDQYKKEISQALNTDFSKITKHCHTLLHKSVLNGDYFLHPCFSEWLYAQLQNQNYLFRRGNNRTQRLKENEIVEYFVVLNKKIATTKYNNTKWSRKYLLTWQDRFQWKLTYHKLSGLNRVLMDLGLIARTEHGDNMPCEYFLGEKNPFKYLYPDQDKDREHGTSNSGIIPTLPTVPRKDITVNQDKVIKI